MRSGSVRSCPRQLPPHLEMTLVYCSRDFSTLRSLYPRQYWSLTTEGGAARDSYECKYICCCVILVLLCLLLSPVFGVSLSSVSFSPSFVVRFLHLQFVCCFRFVGRFPMCLVQDTGLYLFCQFHAQFRFMLARFKFHFSFCGCPFFSSSSGMVI